MGDKALPIQKQKRVLFRNTSLVNPKELVNIVLIILTKYSVGVKIEELAGDIKGFVLSPNSK